MTTRKDHLSFCRVLFLQKAIITEKRPKIPRKSRAAFTGVHRRSVGKIAGEM
jgi:hypothetical protein